MRAIETTIYRCEHCNKLYLRPKWCIKHEVDCVKNQVNRRPCKECAHLENDETIVTTCHSNMNGEPIEEKRTVLYCPELNEFVYPPNIKRPYEITAYDNIPMPLVCASFKDRA